MNSRSPLLLAALLVFSVPASAIRVEKLTVQRVRVAGGAPEPAQIEVVAEEAFVRFKAGVTAAQSDAALARLGFQVLTDFADIGWSVVGLPSGMPVATGLQLLAAAPEVEKAEPNNVYRPNKLPNDPLVSSQYGLTQINAAGAWEYETGSSSRATVAVIDTGVDIAGNQFASKVTNTPAVFCDPGANKTIPGDNAACVADPLPSGVACSHGTHVAGIAAAAANDGASIAGISWGAQILSMRVFRDIDCTSDCGNVACGTDDEAIIRAVNYVTARQNTAAYGKMVINISLGAATACNGGVQTAFNNAVAAGIPVVVSAGNDGGAVNAPANCATAVGGTGIIPAGATDEGNNVTSFSSRGAELNANGLVAPGKSVLTTEVGGGNATATGTSFSAPHVSGVAALILAAKPTFTSGQVQATLRGGSEGIGVASFAPASLGPMGNTSGAGRLNAFRSMRLAVNGTLAGFDGEERPIAFPNPFKPSESGAVSFAVPPSLQGSQTKIKLYTVTGELVRELNGLSWDGKNTQGHPVASGTYIFIVSSSLGTGKGRLALVR